jgi:predicted amidophosphoribosyltransferase
VLAGTGTAVRAALLHVAAARVLVHRLKYQGLAAAAGPLAAAMVGLLDPPPPGLVPVPRALVRRWRYGIDPGRELAAAVGALAGVPVVPALRAGWWHQRRAGPSDASRDLPRFTAAAAVPAGIVLVDDVVTTGSTVGAAARALGGGAEGLTATIAPSAGGGAARRGSHPRRR